MSKTQAKKNTATYSFAERIIVPLLVMIGAALVYYPSLWYGFMFDDYPTITQYFHVRVFDPFGMFFDNPRWLSRVLNQFTYRFWQTNPMAYRIIDLGMHLAIGLMIFYTFLNLLSRLKKGTFARTHAFLLATLSSALFLLHPVQTQTVTYITQMRLEGLATIFAFGVLATFVAYLDAKTKNARMAWLGLSYVLAAFSAGTKEIIIVLPFLLLLVDWFFVAQGDVKDLKSRMYVHAGYFISLYSVLIWMGIRPGHIKKIATVQLKNNRGNILTGGKEEPITMFPYMISQFKVILHYMKIFFWPFNISFDYGMKLSKSIFSRDVILPFLILASITGGMLKLWLTDKTNLFVFSFLWFMAGILPRASVFPSTELVCDYKTYLGSFGAMLALALLATYLIDFIVTQVKDNEMFKNKLQTRMSLVVLFLVLTSVATSQQNKVWSSDFAFWKNAVEGAPESPRCRNNLATAYWDRGRADEAITEFKKAIELDNNYGEPHVNLATIYQTKGDNDTALKHYARAIEIGEGHPELFNNLGILHLGQQNYPTAELCFKQAIELRPYYSMGHKNLGRALQLQGKKEEALASYKNAEHGDAPDENLYYLKGTLCVELSKHQEALESFKKCRDHFLDVQFQLGCVHYHLRQYREANIYFEKAHKQEPNNTIFAHNYAQSLINSGEFAKALPVFELCQKQSKPNELPFLPLHIAKCKLHSGKKDEARKELQTLAQSQNEFLKRDAIALMKEVGIA